MIPGPYHNFDELMAGFSISLILTNFGLLLDLLGAIALAKSFVFKRLSQISLESKAVWNRSPTTAYNLVVQKVEAIMGGTLLAAGFAMQIIGNSGPSRPAEVLVHWPLLVISTLAAIGLYLLILGVVVRRVSNYVFVVLLEDWSQLLSRDEEHFFQHRSYLILEKKCSMGTRTNEPFETYVVRLKEFLADGERQTLGVLSVFRPVIRWLFRE